MIVRRPGAGDRDAVREALTLCGAFHEEEIRVALEMFDAGLAGDYSLAGIETDGVLRGYACFGKAALTRGSWYLYWICVHPSVQRAGLGKALELAVEDLVRQQGGERLVLETSGRPDYEGSRRFYERTGFVVSGCIPDFYRPGDDCLIYSKVLGGRGLNLVVLNLDHARFECTYGRGCDGVCCRNGRPPVYAEEAQRIDASLARILPLLRPEARALVEKAGYLSRRRKAGQPVARVVGGWCVFFNQGCALHQLGQAEGSPFHYKPAVCSMFPLAKDERDRWYVRQKGYKGERWALPCLDPSASSVPAAQSLVDEIALVSTLE